MSFLIIKGQKKKKKQEHTNDGKGRKNKRLREAPYSYILEDCLKWTNIQPILLAFVNIVDLQNLTEMVCKMSVGVRVVGIIIEKRYPYFHI